MFAKKTVKIDPAATDTLIGQSTVFEGRIKSEASLRIEGQIIGDIECIGDVTIGEMGFAKSNITAREIIIAGKVQGNVVAKGTLNITSSGQLTGNATTKSLVISEGGIFQGSSKMDSKSEAKADSKKESAGAGNTSLTSKSDAHENKLPNGANSGQQEKNVGMQFHA